MGNILRILCCALLFISPAWGAAPVPGATVQELLQWLEQGNGEIAAAKSDTQSARLRAESAGSLPDPSVRIEWQDINGLNVLPGQAGAMKYTVLQALPGWGKRDAQKQVASAQTAVAQEQERALSTELRSRVKLEFARYYRTYQALQLNEELGKFADTVADLAKSRYESGLTTQQELIRAQLEQSALRSEHISLHSAYSQSQARINALLNRPADAELAAPASLRALPPPAVLNPETLEQKLSQSNPQLAGLVAQTTVSLSSSELANKNLTPDFVLGVGPVQRGSRFSTWEAMLEFTVPLQRSSHGAHQREAEEMLQADRARLMGAEARLLAELREHYAALQGAREQETLTQQQVLPLAELAFNGALAGYQNGRVDFATLLEARRQIQKAKLDELDARIEQQIHLAEIERLTGEEL
ncbi:MAG: TolC family protein [Nitrosomonadales bacterium]|nr:TolC family protein [Nitrosomonadales bacterium]